MSSTITVSHDRDTIARSRPEIAAPL